MVTKCNVKIIAFEDYAWSQNFISIWMNLPAVLVWMQQLFYFRKALCQNKGYLSVEDS